jgi:hypothetical protein
MTEFQIVITCATEHGAYYFMDDIGALHDVAVAAGFAVRPNTVENRPISVKAVEIVKTTTVTVLTRS